MEKAPVYLLTYDHGGYVLWGEHFEERIESAVEWLEKYPKFKIGMDNESFAYDKYSDINPEIIKNLNKILNKFKGRFAIGSSTYGQPLSVFINDESNVRQITYAIKTNLEHFNQRPKVFAISEHALHSQIPQLIVQAGYEGAIMRTHFMMYGYNPTYDVPYGLWVGEDGTKIPTVPTYKDEGSEFAITTYDNWVLTRWPDQTDQSLEDFAEKFKHITPLLASRYDDVILRCEQLVKHAETMPEYYWVLLDDILEIYDKPVTEFRPTANEFKVRMPWGYCGNKIFNDCRDAERSVGLAEKVNAASFLIGGEALESSLESAWKNLLITQHHDIQICGLLSDEEEYITKSLEASKIVIDQSIKFISKQFISDSQHNLLIFNPAAHTRYEIAEIEVKLERGNGVDGFKVYLGEEEIPCKVVAIDKRLDKISRAKVYFKAEVPGFSACAYKVVPIKTLLVQNTASAFSYDEKSQTLSTPFYTAVFNKFGIAEMKYIDGKPISSSQTGSLFKGIIDGIDSVSVGEWSVQMDSYSATAIHIGKIGSLLFRFDMKFSEIDERIDCHVEFDHHGETIGVAKKFEVFKENTNGFIHEEKLRFALSHTMDENVLGYRDLPFKIESTTDKYIQGNYWTAIVDENKTGIAYFNSGAMCAIKEDGVFSIPIAYANEYVWGTRMLYGKYTHNFSILPFTEFCQTTIHNKSLEYQQPFVKHSFQSQENGKYDKCVTFMSFDCHESTVLTALYPEKGAVIARLFECANTAGKLNLCSEFLTVDTEINILGETVAECDGQNISIAPWEIKSFKLNKSCGENKD